MFVSRFPKGESLWRPGSHCPFCKQSIKVYYNIPVLGWIILRGRCSECHVRIPIRYPLIELSFGLLTVLLLWRFGVDASLFYWLPFFWTLALVAWVDWETSYIYDVTTLPLLALGLAGPWLWSGFAASWWTPIAGATLMWFLMEGSYLLVRKLTGREALGGGDVKLMIALGAFLGPLGALRALVFVALVSTPYWLVTQKLKGLGPRDPFPFGPPLVLGGMISAWELLSGDLSSWFEINGLQDLAWLFLI